MKYLFLILFVLLSLATAARVSLLPDLRRDVPVIYWATDNNPARVEQVRLFHDWLIAKGHVTPEGKPVCELRLDTANNAQQKLVIQGVSGVASDLFDVWSGAGARYFSSMGLLENLNDEAARLGFDPSRTFPAIAPEIVIDGVQYSFPCNVGTNHYWANVARFEELGVTVPPQDWTFQEYERIGRAFVAAANADKPRYRVFFADTINPIVLTRSTGLTVYNETLTACVLDDERYVRILALIHRWTFEERLLPSAADRSAFATDSGYLGAPMQLFNSGQYGMVWMGRYSLIQFRKFNEERRAAGRPILKLSVTNPPYDHFLNANAGTRACAMYAGSKHKDLAALFLAYLADDIYNMQIVRDADALPPNPAYTRIEEFHRPPDYPQEWGLHTPYADAALRIGIPMDISPFIVPADASRHLARGQDAVMSNVLSPQRAAFETQRDINEGIRRTLKENPNLRPRYEAQLELQKKIDARKAACEPIPAAWVQNPFHLKYYAHQGWLEDSPDSATIPRDRKIGPGPP